MGDDTSSQDDDQLDSKSGSLASQHSINYASSQSSLTSLPTNQPDDMLPPTILHRDRSVSTPISVPAQFGWRFLQRLGPPSHPCWLSLLPSLPQVVTS